MIRKVFAGDITRLVAQLAVRANINLRPDVYRALTLSLAKENNQRARGILKLLLENAAYARKFNLAICQDTGLPYVFVELGQKSLVCGGDFVKAINKGIARGYQRGFLRNSVISHPLVRNSRPGFSPAVIHIDSVPGERIKITVLPKGFGSENKGQVRMFRPTAAIGEIKQFVVQAVSEAGADACPPYVIGVGIGGGLDQAALLAKKALLYPLGRKNPDRILARLKKELLKEINLLGLGPMGLGGETTCLGVNILSLPTHIAGLPVAVNISCHALRSASGSI